MNNFIDVCKLLGNYNDKDVYLYMSSKYKPNSIFLFSKLLFTA